MKIPIRKTMDEWMERELQIMADRFCGQILEMIACCGNGGLTVSEAIEHAATLMSDQSENWNPTDD